MCFHALPRLCKYRTYFIDCYLSIFKGTFCYLLPDLT